MSASERRKGNNSIEIVNNYRFQIKSRRNEKRYVKCCGYNNITCHVTGYILEDGSCHFRGVHQHPTIEHEIALEVFKDKLWLEVMTNESDGLRAMYDKCARESPGIASEITFTSIERSMARWRLQFRPQIPATLFQYGEILNSERWEKFRDYPGGRLTVRTIEVNATTTVCVFGDPIFLTSVPARVELYIDATFKVCPKNPKVAQFFTIMAQVDDAAVPIAWAHMSNKTAEAYRVILAHFRQELAPHIQPTVVHLDFERSEEIAVRQVYPETTLLHCFFHYVQAMFRQLKTKLGDVGMNRMQNWPLAQGVFRKLLALALLPAESILPSYEWLIENTPNDIREFYAEFFHYYQTWWLTRVRPERYSVYGHNTRTNNAIEAYHRVLHCDCGDHPGIWKFTGHFILLSKDSRSASESID
uniref:MULE transposase domain-containing protein n=1 Tax=Fopius arisanus TaxID=64838 RepID=A0A0C9RF33_9HYME